GIRKHRLKRRRRASDIVSRLILTKAFAAASSGIEVRVRVSALSGLRLHAHRIPTQAIQTPAILPQRLTAFGTNVSRQKLILGTLHFGLPCGCESQRFVHALDLSAQYLFLTRTVAIHRDAFATKLVRQNVCSPYVVDARLAGEVDRLGNRGIDASLK